MGEVKKLFLMLAAVAAFILVVGLISKNKLQVGTSNSNLKTVKVGMSQVLVTVADTDETRKRGLSGITNLPVNQGMLFVFDKKTATPSFWMKGMLIPLDMIWIKEGRITQIDANIPNPTPGTLDSQLKIYSPGQPVDYVLEVNAGFSEKNNIKVGDMVTLSL